MKYFTKQRWIDAQQPGDGQDVGRRYDEAFAAYARQLELLRSRLPADAFAFFESADVHDGNRVGVELAVAEWTRTEWTLRYAAIRRILVDFPTESPLFFHPGGGFEYWGYHELSDAGDGFLRHEVFFSSGSNRAHRVP